MDEEPVKDFGLIPDRSAWESDLGPATSTVGAYQVFRPATIGDTAGPIAMARTDSIGVYARHFRAGGGEKGLHSHDKDAVWVVLEGRALFRDESGSTTASVSAHEGLLIPRFVSYRFTCPVDSTLVRVSAAFCE